MVTNLEIVRNETVCHFIRNAMRSVFLAIDCEHSVSMTLVSCPLPARGRTRHVHVRPEPFNKIDAALMTSDVMQRLTFCQAAPGSGSLANPRLFPAPAMAIAVWNFTRGFRSGILRHVNSSFQAVGRAAGCFNIAAAFHSLIIPQVAEMINVDPDPIPGDPLILVTLTRIEARLNALAAHLGA